MYAHVNVGVGYMTCLLVLLEALPATVIVFDLASTALWHRLN